MLLRDYRLSVALAFLTVCSAVQPNARAADNLFGNASFEDGRDLWQCSRPARPPPSSPSTSKDAAAGQRSALLSIGSVDDWGVQFGQIMDAPEPGKTYTFAVLAKSTKEPVTVRLEIERQAKPYDRAAASRAAYGHQGRLDRAARDLQGREAVSARAGSPT